MSARTDYAVLGAVADCEPDPSWPVVLVTAARAALAELDSLRAEVDRLRALVAGRDTERVGCEDCGRPYGDPGFPDLVVDHDVWELLMPNRNGGGLLCPSCMCARAEVLGLQAVATFRSGPFCVAGRDTPTPDPPPDAEHEPDPISGSGALSVLSMCRTCHSTIRKINGVWEHWESSVPYESMVIGAVPVQEPTPHQPTWLSRPSDHIEDPYPPLVQETTPGLMVSSNQSPEPTCTTCDAEDS